MSQPAKKAKTAASNGTAGILLTFGESMIRFAPLDESAIFYCKDCDKFLAEDAFEGATNGVDAVPGKRVCLSCEEFADMGW